MTARQNTVFAICSVVASTFANWLLCLGSGTGLASKLFVLWLF